MVGGQCCARVLNSKSEVSAGLLSRVRLRTKAARTIGAYEPSEPWYGRFFADFLLVLLIVLSFQVRSFCRGPRVSLLGSSMVLMMVMMIKYFQL